MANTEQNDNLQKIQSSQELMAKMQRMHEIQSELDKMGAMGLVSELLKIKEQMNALFEKPKRIRRTKAQMQEAREKAMQEQEAKEQIKKPRAKKPKGNGSND
ncbi:hypothetical protein [Helicobacter heilmannii]|uniref:hypothetical protein n=1 Tax=Helicobacter heilmannii TaxID=35817 RepID=UPI000CF0EA89|nr:hypothetical protein [Helicobacter heilmannii]